jgi:hypothetical protein
MPIKNTGTAHAVFLQISPFAMAATKRPIKHPSNFHLKLKQINGSADADDQDENRIVTGPISSLNLISLKIRQILFLYRMRIYIFHDGSQQ